MTSWKTEQDLDAYLSAAAAAVDLEIAAEHRPGVRTFLVIAAEMAETLNRIPPTDDEASLAPVFRLPGQE